MSSLTVPWLIHWWRLANEEHRQYKCAIFHKTKNIFSAQVSQLNASRELGKRKEYLSSDYEVGVHRHGSTVTDEVSYGLHDIPRILPPRESRQEAELKPHGPQTQPSQPTCSYGGHLRYCMPFLVTERTQRELFVSNSPHGRTNTQWTTDNSHIAWSSCADGDK